MRTMLFDNCRAQADTAAGDGESMDLSTKAKARKAKGKFKNNALLDTVINAKVGDT